VNAAVERRTFGVSADEVAAIDSWVEQVATQWGESPRTVFRTRICIAELAANVLEHGLSRSGDHHIVVTLRHLRDGIGVELLDSCPLFDPTGKIAVANAATIEALRPGGWGLRLVRAYANDLSYCNDDARNRVSLKINSA
jgi:anti-sigma regulatory factor (Ser/Thr protein kinase)